MALANFPASLDFVWRRGFDSPLDDYHTTPGDPGGGTKGGVIEATWRGCVRTGLVHGLLHDATDTDLALVLRSVIWVPACNILPPGLDLLYFNGRMMSGGYPRLLQQSLGFMGDDLDGWVGVETLTAAQAADTSTLINALSGAHYAYVSRLPNFEQSRNGWTTRLKAAQVAALALAEDFPGHPTPAVA